MDYDGFDLLSFDCYGTIIDWEAGILSAMKPIFRSHGVEIPDNEILERYASYEEEIESGDYLPYREVLKGVVRRFGENYHIEPSSHEAESLADSIVDWKAFPDTLGALERLSERYSLAILSNVDDDLFGSSARRLSVEFDHVFTAQQIGSYKPDRRNFEYLISHSGVPKEKILHVAQSLFHDVVPAKEIGLASIWVNRRSGKTGYGATPPADVSPDIELNNLSELVSLIG